MKKEKHYMVESQRGGEGEEEDWKDIYEYEMTVLTLLY